MSILAEDPGIQLAFSVYGNRGVYALLLGSGLSRAAGIPTGWEITLDLVRRVAAIRGVEDQADWAGWYKATVASEPSYSELVGMLGLSRDERRSILHSYIEPTAADRDEGLKLPTKAHEAIASLVREGYVRVIITTNFDRLLENALREQGVEPTVIASVDALQGAEPLAHSTCYLVKLHGDYKDARILNTDEELCAYPPEYDRLLDRIIDDHGLIVCGWSGDWDHALRAALLRAPSRRYPMFWAARGKLGEGADEIAKHRDARVISIADADGFFVGLEQRIQTLARTHRKNPLSVDLLVSSAKRYLAKPEHRIELDDLLSSETQSLIEKLDAVNLPTDGTWSVGEFRRRVELYESLSEPVSRMAGVLGRWGSGGEKGLILDIVRMLCAHADREGAGLNAWLEIRSYPAVLVMIGYGLGLVRSERWVELHELFAAELREQHGNGRSRVVDRLLLWAWPGGENERWQSLNGLERHKTALSDHQLRLFDDWGRSFSGVVPEFAMLYESFEILGGLAYLERYDLAEIASNLAEEPRNGWVFFPIGRSAWNVRMRERILERFLSEQTKAGLLKAGFSKGNEDFLQLSVANYRRMAPRV